MSSPEIVVGRVTPRIGAHRLALRVAYRVLQVWWYVGRPDIYGVKLLVRSGDEVLFVRHTYGGRGDWELPGGGQRRGEDAAPAARREAREELGIDIADWDPVGPVTYKHGATAHLTCLTAEVDSGPITIDLCEIATAQWAPADRPPAPLSATARLALEVFEAPRP